MEKLRYRRGHPGDAPYVASGVVLGMSDGRPYRLNYKLKLESNWQARKAVFEVSTVDDTLTRMLRTDGIGHWRDDTGALLTELNGCLDIDIEATPFTAMLPIRRLKQAEGQQQDISVIYVEVPTLAFAAVRQRYACVEPLKPGVAGGRYIQEGPIGEFKAEIAVDLDGIVIDYPPLFRRVYPV
jgi:hypothetical protein